MTASGCCCVQGEDDVPPRPPLPQLYSPDEQPPAVPPLPRESNVIRHTSVRGLKRQSDERKRDRETVQYSNGDAKVGPQGRRDLEPPPPPNPSHPPLTLLSRPRSSQAELRPYLSDPELVGAGDGAAGPALGGWDGYLTLPSRGTERSGARLHLSPRTTCVNDVGSAPLRAQRHRGPAQPVLGHRLLRDPAQDHLHGAGEGEAPGPRPVNQRDSRLGMDLLKMSGTAGFHFHSLAQHATVRPPHRRALRGR